MENIDNIFDPKITVFKSLFDTATPFKLSLSEVMNRISKGNPLLHEKIKVIRDKETSPEKKSSEKKKLLPIMFNGTFSERNDDALIDHSGVCVLDFDGYPDEKTLEEEKNKLINDKYTLGVFVSPSGNGLKSLIRIPVSTKQEHIRRFNAYEKYINSDYFDVKNKNVSRVCFESFDPELYFNQECKVFDDIEEDKGYKFIEKAPIIILKDENEIINRVLNFNRKDSFIDGNRNNFIFNIASQLCEYGVDKFSAESAIFNNYCDDDFKESEARAAVKSAYKSREFGRSYFEDYDKLKIAQNKIIRGVDDDEIKNSLNLDDDTIEEIKEDVEKTEYNFWVITEDKNKRKTISIPPYKLMTFLSKKGFYKYYPENSEQAVIINIDENLVSLSSSSIIVDYISTYLIEKDLIEVYNYCFRNQNIFSDKSLTWLKSKKLLMLEDTKDISYIPFRNGVLEVKKNGVKQINLVDIGKFIWKNQIINRDFNLINDFQNDFQNFVSKVSNDDVNRVESLETTIGYLAQTFKDKTDQKAIIFNDEEINDNPNGGSGKSLMLTALSNFRRVVKLDGKAFDPNKSDFIYQRVNLDTQILAFDDVKRKFNFESLFSLITEGIAVNRKNKEEIFIPFERSPKIIITTNYVIDGAGSSHDRRRHEIEFNQYFNGKHSPLIEYGRLLFDEWSEEDFNKFDNYIVYCIQLFFKKGLIKNDSINADAKRLIQSTCKDFYDFIIEEGIQLNTKIINSHYLASFIAENKSFQNLNNRVFLKWISEYAKYRNYDIEKGRSKDGMWFKLTDPNNLPATTNFNEDEPF